MEHFVSIVSFCAVVEDSAVRVPKKEERTGDGGTLLGSPVVAFIAVEVLQRPETYDVFRTRQQKVTYFLPSAAGEVELARSFCRDIVGNPLFGAGVHNPASGFI
jgi:hypothetical protein